MAFLDNFKFQNPFSGAFDKNREIDDIIERQIETNSQGLSDVELGMNNGAGADASNGYYGQANTNIEFSQSFSNKKDRVAKYREMSFFPEVAEGLEMFADEAIVENDEGEITHPVFRKEVPDKVKKAFLKEFHYVANDVLKESEKMYDIFTKYIIDGELYMEWILNKKKDNIIGFKMLPPFSTIPVYAASGNVRGFFQTVYKDNKEQLVPFAPNQISYVNWGKFGTSLLDVRGYLDTTIRTYNQLRNIEDSLIVYRLVRAPERRVWNIEAGRMPTSKKEEYVKKIIHKNKRKLNYDPATGAIDSSRNVQSLSEDYWFLKQEGSGTDVTTMASGMNLGELDDVRYFLAKMYKTLRIPKTRWDPQLGQQNYSIGRELDRDELKFTLFVNRAQKRFKKIPRDCWIEQCRFKYAKDKEMVKYANIKYLDVRFTQANFFKEIKELEQIEGRLNVLGTAISYVNTPDEPDNPFDLEFVLKHYFKMSEEEYKLNEKMLAKTKKKRMETGDEIDVTAIESVERQQALIENVESYRKFLAENKKSNDKNGGS